MTFLSFPTLPKKKKALKFVERQIDDGLSRVLNHPAFLRSASVVINFNSYRRKLVRHTLETALAKAELPLKSDQERMYAMLEQLKARVEDLEGRADG